ncbi:hypothetical protein CK203_087544 [Vitis vinifera]|uniref:Uncharacterized protein n=1 Tax=Vitis vinifera TaxID=29760 RepID=A0A438DAA7_VITVI|nr:hypothetical protein CK203_087544 [Vitis vinifera]
MGGLSLSNSQNERFCNFLFNSSSMSAPSRTWLSHCPISCGTPPFPIQFSTNDFDFCVYESFYQDTSSADELFYDGKILPIQIKKKIATPKSAVQQPKPPLPLAPPPLPTQNNRKKESSREIKRTINEVYEKQNSKSFWRFKRSTSLNCSSGYARSLCPLPLLSRSNSTGSVSNAKRSALSSKMEIISRIGTNIPLLHP